MHSPIKHLLTGDELAANTLNHLLNLAEIVKKDKLRYSTLLKNQQVALLFEKPSTRTRFSFMSAVHELGGLAIESVSTTRKQETPEDLMRVLQGYCSAVMIRAHEESQLERMMSVATIPVINGLTEFYHPCQTLADLLTLKEQFGELKALTIAYIGDGNNILHSLLLMAPKLGIQVNYCCPNGHQPNADIVKTAGANDRSRLIKPFQSPLEAVRHTHAVYTDVWTSMGFEEKNETDFSGYQVNEQLMAQANKNAVFMHCMPMNRGEEVSETLPDQPCSVIFQQSENRLHAQKALLIHLLTGESND